MKMSKKVIGGTYEILAAEYFQANPITVAAPGEGTIVKAGTPLTAAGVATTGSNAVGILLYDVDTAANPNGAAVWFGAIDAAKAQAISGIEYSMSDLKAALPAINFRSDIGAKGDNTALSTLTITGGTLTPTFNKGVRSYTLATTATTSTVTVATDDSNASAVIKNGLTTVTSGSTATWSDGENTLKVTVTAENGVSTGVYTVAVTKS